MNKKIQQTLPFWISLIGAGMIALMSAVGSCRSLEQTAQPPSAVEQEERATATQNLDWFKGNSTYIWDDWKIR